MSPNFVLLGIVFQNVAALLANGTFGEFLFLILYAKAAQLRGHKEAPVIRLQQIANDVLQSVVHAAQRDIAIRQHNVMVIVGSACAQ